MKTFTYPVAIDSVAQVEYAVRRVQFGDGFEQRAPKSLRPALEKWSVSAVGTKSQVDEIKQFLDEHAGVKAFLWRLNDSEDYKRYTVKGYKRTYKGGSLWTIAFELQEVTA